jgi:hypothetical protein
MKYMFILPLLLSHVFAATDLAPIDDDATLEAIDRALEKARAEFTTFKLDSKRLNELKIHYESHLTDIIICNFVKYYLGGTCDLHELLAIVQALEENDTILIALSDEPDFEQFNREFLYKLTTYN